MYRIATLLLLVALALPTAGCNKRFQRYTASFGAAGAGAGAAYGAAAGGVTALEGAAIGGTGGGLVGAMVADAYSEEDWAGLNAEIARLKGENETQAIALAAKDRQLADRDAMLADAESRRGMENGRVNDLTGSLAAAQAERDRLAAERAALAEERDRLAAERGDLEAQLVANRSDLEGKARELADLQERLGKDITVSQGANGIELTILNELLFAEGRADLSRDGMAVITRAADTIRDLYPDNKLVIEGHTDNQPISKSQWRSNWELGAGRALAVVHHLIESEAFTPARLAAISYADTRPAVANTSAEARANNRRAVIVILPGDGQPAAVPAVASSAAPTLQPTYVTAQIAPVLQ